MGDETKEIPITFTEEFDGISLEDVKLLWDLYIKKDQYKEAECFANKMGNRSIL